MPTNPIHPIWIPDSKGVLRTSLAGFEAKVCFRRMRWVAVTDEMTSRDCTSITDAIAMAESSLVRLATGDMR